MKYTIQFSLALLLSFSGAHSHKLEHNLLVMLDGRSLGSLGIDGGSIAKIKRYQSDLLKMMQGKAIGTELLEDGTSTIIHEGLYQFGTNKYSVNQLVEIEREGLLSQEDTKNIIKVMREDFKKASIPFEAIVRQSAKPMQELIEQSCRFRGRLERDCLMLEWTKSGSKDEEILFDQNIKTMRDFQIFIFDIYNFLEDLIESCPKAVDQYEASKARLKHVRSLLSELNIAKTKEARYIKLVLSKAGSKKMEEITLNFVKDIIKDQ